MLNNNTNIKTDKEKKKEINIDNKDAYLEKINKKKELKKLELEYQKLNIKVKEKIELYELEIKKNKQRLQKKVSNMYNFFLIDYFKSIVQILDSIECSLEEFKKIENYKENKLYEMVYNIYKKLINIFKIYSISKIDEVNVPFNPEMHQAMSLDFSKKYPKNFVASIIQKGYHIQGRLLRPAIVSVIN